MNRTRRLTLLAAVAFTPAAALAQTYVISNAPIEFPVNTPGATYTISGIFPSPNFSAGGKQYGVCFYTGYGASATPIVPANETFIGNGNYSASVTVPASSFQVTAGFGTDGINRSGSFYIALANSTCNGVVNTSLTSYSPLLIALPPTLTSAAANTVQQPNPNLGVIPPPRTVTFAGSYFYGYNNGGPATVHFTWTSSTSSSATVVASVVPSLNSLVASTPPLPADVSNLTAAICNPVGTYTSCSAPISLAVNALATSTGSVSSSASPATLGTSVNLSASFSPGAATGPGGNGPMPAGTVTFTSDNTGSVVTIGTAPLVLDPATSQWVQGGSNQLRINGPYPSLPTVATDLNSDGLADVMLYSDSYSYTNQSTQVVVPAQFTILLGNMPYGTFQTATTLAVPSNCASVTSYALGDLNQDGFPDLVLACVPLSPTTNDPYETYVMLGNGDGTFQASYQITGVTGNLLALIDVNKDGKLDLVSQGPIYGQSSTNSYGFVVLQGDGYGDLYAPNTNSSYPGSTTTTGTSQPGSQFLMVDLNNDGYPDLAELHNNGTNGNTIDIYLNHGGTYFGGGPANGGIKPDTYIKLGAAPNSYSSLFAGDLNKDGLPDLGAAQTTSTGNSNPYSIDYVLSTGTGATPTYGALQSLGVPNMPSFVAAADFTGDGYPDLLVGSGNTHVYDNDRTGHFGSNTDLYSATNFAPVVIAAVDLNGNSVADLILGSTTYATSGQAFNVTGNITSGAAIATLPYTFTTGTNANITAQWPGSVSVAAPATAPTLSLPLTGGTPAGPRYSITNSNPSSIALGSGDTKIYIEGTLPTLSSQTFGICFFTGYGDSSSPIYPVGGSATFTAPASSIQQVPASAFSNGAFQAQVYFTAGGSTCTGTPDPAVSNSYAIPIVSSQATITGLQVPFVPAGNQSLGGEGGAPPYPALLLATGSNFLGTGQTPNYDSGTPLTQIFEIVDGSGSTQQYYGSTIFNSTSFAANPLNYPTPSTSVGIQACDNLGSPCSNTVTIPVHALEINNGTATYQVLNANTETFNIPASGTHQAAVAGFSYDTSAATYPSLTNVSPSAPQATGQYSVSSTGLYTFYSGDIGTSITLTYDTTATTTAPTSSNPVALKATFGTATPDVTGAPSGGVNFFDSDTYTSYYASLSLDPTATWVTGGGGSANALGDTLLQPTILDFNNDLIPDVLVVDDGSDSGIPSLQLLTGSLPSGTYTTGTLFNVQSVLPNCYTIASYAVADFNQDGYPDVAILCTPISGTANTLSVLLNNGDGTFNTTAITYGGSITGTQIATGDFDGDGHPDIVYTTTLTQGATSTVQTLTNPNGDGNFQTPDYFTNITIAKDAQLATADFDQDGYSDLVVLNGNASTPNIAVYQNVGAAAGTSVGSQFNTTPVTIAIPSAAAVRSFSIVSLQQYLPPSIVFPVTGSTNPGVYAVRNTSSQGSYSAPGTIAFAPTVITPVPGLTNAVFGDINGDGNLDAVADNGTNLIALTGDGTGAFNGVAFTALSITDSGNTLLALTDLNYDGYADLLTFGLPLQTAARPGSGVSSRIARTAVQPHDTSSNNLHSYISAGTATAITTPATFANGAHDFQVTTPGTVQIASGSVTTKFSVNNFTTTVAVNSTATPYPYGQSLQIYATVTGSPSGTPTGNVTFYDGSTPLATYSLNNGTVNFAYNGFSVGSHDLTAQYATDGTYPAATSPIYTQVITAATPALTWATPAAITYGTALSATQLNAVAKDSNGNAIPGTFSYTPTASTVLGAGNQNLNVLFTPTDGVSYTTATKTVTLVVNKATPTITWATPAAITYGTALSATQLNASTPVPGVFTYTPNTGTILTAGTQTLSVGFVPTDTTDYVSVPAKTTTILVNKATPTITWATPAAITYGTALSGTQLNATTPTPGVFTYTPASGAILNAGTQTLSVGFVPTDSTDYVSVPATTTSLLVNKANPLLTYTPTPLALTYGTALTGSQLGATSSDPTGTFAYTYTGTASGTTLPGAVLGAGSYLLKATFTPTDTNYNTASINGGTLVVSQATPALTWATPADIIAGVPLSATQLNAAVTGAIPGTLTYTPTSGTVLASGNGQTLSVKFTPTDAVDYTTATRTTTLNVIPLVITSVSPNNALLGDPAKPVTLTGTGFLANSIVQANGTAIATTYVNATTLTATIPASSFLTFSPIAITVLDPTQALTSSSSAVTIAAPVPAVTFTGPGTTPPAQQPSLTFTLNNPYPVPLVDTVNLTFAGTGGVDDPAIQFATGGRSLVFTIPANSTATPNLQFQDGTDAGTITATLSMTALGTNVTPTSLQPITIVIPPAPPAIATATLTRSGKTLTVFIVGYSNTRDMTSATFHFNAAPGVTINDPNIVITAPALFTPWYSTVASQAYGSNFGYTQTFNLDTDASSVGSVSIMLTNSFGNSITVTAQ